MDHGLKILPIKMYLRKGYCLDREMVKVNDNWKLLCRFHFNILVSVRRFSEAAKQYNAKDKTGLQLKYKEFAFRLSVSLLNPNVHFELRNTSMIPQGYHCSFITMAKCLEMTRFLLRRVTWYTKVNQQYLI